MTTPRVRFAPSPTGDLHIGNVRTALYAWLWARKTGGTFILRIEDTDRERSTDASRASVLETMRWLGMDWDEGLVEDGSELGARGPYAQMQRLAIYKQFADQLVLERKAYRCYCRAQDLDAQRDAVEASGGHYKYPGTCRDRTDEPDLPFVIRFIADTAGAVVYDDIVFKKKPIKTPNKELQDFVLVRADGVPLYNFGCVVDDITMGVTLVSRGRDHMINTPMQIQLYRALGSTLPAFAHLPMLLAPNGELLSKRHGGASVREYRECGVVPDGLLNYLARLGWSHGDDEIFTRSQLIAAFDWSNCGASDCRINPAKLTAINHAHLQTLVTHDDYVTRLLPFLAARNLDVSRDAVSRALFTVRERAETFPHAAELLDPFFRDPPELDADAARRFLVPTIAPHLRGLRDALAIHDDWSPSALEQRTNHWLASASVALRDVGQPLRVALTGRTASASLFDVLFVLGRDRSLVRLDRAIAQAQESSFSAQ